LDNLAIVEPLQTQIGTQKGARQTQRQQIQNSKIKKSTMAGFELQSPDPKSGALSIMPHGLLSDNKHARP
jgi:hypothetical protein